VTNHPPTANPATYSHPAGIQLRIVLTDLATNWTDMDGDTVVLSGVNSSTNGASITFDSNFVYYPAATVNDQFTYTISDGYGGTNTGVVDVIISASTNVTQNITGETLNEDGSLTINFASVPGSTNVVETTPSLSPPIIWTPASTNTAGTNGLWQFTDPSPTGPVLFYRSMRQP
jgi:hypothetical protein